MSQKYIVSVGMSNYCIYGGGTNLATKGYQKEYNNKGISYIYIAPLLLHGKRYNIASKYWSIAVDGIFVADLTTEGLINYLRMINDSGASVLELHVHHFKFINFIEFERLVDYLKCRIIMFIHDYSTICAHFTLLTTDMAYCGDGGIWKEKCKLCKFYSFSIDVINRYTTFWDKIKNNVTFIFPSEVAKNVWLSANPDYSNAVRVVPHQILSGVYKGNCDIVDGSRLRIAYLGAREYHKGWDSYYKVFEKYKDDDKFSWFYLGTDSVDESRITSIYVDNNKNKDAMIEALRDNKIDVVILWSICKETYSYTFFESFAANAYIVTNKNSGNIAHQVTLNKNGIVLEDENNLIELFDTDIISKVDIFKKSSIQCPKKLITNTELINEVKLNNNSCIQLKPKMKTLESVFYFVEKLHLVLKQMIHRR